MESSLNNFSEEFMVPWNVSTSANPFSLSVGTGFWPKAVIGNAVSTAIHFRTCDFMVHYLLVRICCIAKTMATILCRTWPACSNHLGNRGQKATEHTGVLSAPRVSTLREN